MIFQIVTRHIFRSIFVMITAEGNEKSTRDDRWIFL